jgi:plastocyanin
MPHSATFLRFVPAAVMLVLALGSAAAADQASALVRDEIPTTSGAGCRFGEWQVSGGWMAPWRDGAQGNTDLETAIGATDTVPSSAAEACGATHRASPVVAPGEDEPPLATFDVEARDLWFSPAKLTVSGSGSSTIRLENAGRVVHNLTVDELGIEIVVTRGGRSEVILTDAKPGTYAFYCSISGHREAGMEGTLTIQ